MASIWRKMFSFKINSLWYLDECLFFQNCLLKFPDSELTEILECQLLSLTAGTSANHCPPKLTIKPFQNKFKFTSSGIFIKRKSDSFVFVVIFFCKYVHAMSILIVWSITDSLTIYSSKIFVCRKVLASWISNSMFYVAHANINFCPEGKLKRQDSNMHTPDCFQPRKAKECTIPLQLFHAHIFSFVLYTLYVHRSC